MRAPEPIVEWPRGDTGARALGASAGRYGALALFGLTMLEVVYRTGVQLRNLSYDVGVRKTHRANVPVISIGNVVAGGAGKTPFTRWLTAELLNRGRRPAVVHGGYGSDEPALHRKWHPDVIVIEAADRVAAVAAAEQRGADVIVLDDAFQHRRLARDLDIVLVPAETTSSHLLPRGPLREPDTALTRAGLIVVTRKTAALARARAVALRIHAEWRRPTAVAAILPVADDAIADGDTAIAVAGIARPDLMLLQLQARGVAVRKLLAYPDHYDYTNEDAAHIREAAGADPILTTEKDAVKLLPLLAGADMRVIEQRVVIEEGADILRQQLAHVL